MTAHHDPDLDDVLQDQELLHLARLLSSAQRAEPPLDEAFRSGLRRQLLRRAWEMGDGRPSFWDRFLAPPIMAWAGAAAGVVLIASVVIWMALQPPSALSRIVINSPIDGQSAVNLGQPILVAFNQPMNHASTEAAVQITPTTTVTYTWRTDSELAVQPTNGNLAPNTQYKVTIGSGAKTAAGQPLAAPSTITFVTQPVTTPAPSPSPKAPSPPSSLLKDEHQVASVPGGGTPALEWSADSATVYFVDSGGRLEVVDVRSGAVNVVAADGASSPAIAPAGDRLAYIRAGKVEVLTFATGNTAEIAPPTTPTVVAWAKDAVVWGASDGFYDEKAGGPIELAPLPPAVNQVSVVSIAPNFGNAIIEDGNRLEVFNPSNGNNVLLGVGAQFQGWSPDGTKLMYATSGGTVVADTKNTILATLPGGEPSWSSQDAILIGGDVDLHQVRPDGSATTKLANGTYRAPSWAPNGSTFAFFRGGALWTATAPPLPSLPTTLDLAGVTVASFMQARLQNQTNVANGFLDDNGRQAYASGPSLIPSGDPRFSRYYILTQEVTATRPVAAVFVVRLVLSQGKDDVRDYEETLTLLRDPISNRFVIDQASATPPRDRGKGAEVVSVDLASTTVKVTFDSDLDPSTVAGALLVLDDKGKQLDGVVTYANVNRTVTIAGLDLKAGAQYKLVVLATVRDVVGNNVSEYDLQILGPLLNQRVGFGAGTTDQTVGGGAQASPTASPS